MIQTKNNQLYIEGISFKDLADQYGTPLYIYDQAALEKRMETYYNTFTSPLFETKVLYASKAFLCKAMVKLAQNILYAWMSSQAGSFISQNKPDSIWIVCIFMVTTKPRRN